MPGDSTAMRVLIVEDDSTTRLRLEKMFRSLYDDVRKGVVTEPFDLNFMRYDETADEPRPGRRRTGVRRPGRGRQHSVGWFRPFWALFWDV